MKSKAASFGVIGNNGPANLRDTLKVVLTHASHVSIAVAFVTQSGLTEILLPLRQVAARGSVRFLTGLYQRFTDPEALRTLLQVQGECGKRFSVRLSREPLFHRKMYLLEQKTQSMAIVGSSNLTKDGLQSGGELNLMVSASRNSPLVRELKHVFDIEWEHRAVTLSIVQIRKYGRTRPRHWKVPGYTRNELKDILGMEALHHGAGGDSQKPIKYWRDYVTGAVAKRTSKALSQYTNWDKRNYLYVAVGRVTSYKVGHRILMFDFADKKLCLVEVRDIAHTPVPTPDGRRFVAYRPVRGYDRRLTNTLWDLLKKERISRSGARNFMPVSEAKAKRLMRLIRHRSRA